MPKMAEKAKMAETGKIPKWTIWPNGKNAIKVEMNKKN